MILKVDVSLGIALGFFLMTVGYWMMRTKCKAFAVPVNTILCVISVVLATAWGCMSFGFTFGSVISYGLPNGILCWIAATTAYDFIHEYVKRKDDWLSVWKSFTALFKKKEAKA